MYDFQGLSGRATKQGTGGQRPGVLQASVSLESATPGKRWHKLNINPSCKMFQCTKISNEGNMVSKCTFRQSEKGWLDFGTLCMFEMVI